MATPVKKLLAISWAMPPMLYPRSIQVARVLSQLHKLGWEITVICNTPQHTNKNDPSLSILYDNSYKKIYIEADNIGQDDALITSWFAPAYQKAIHEIKSNQYLALITFAQPWVDHLIGLELHHATRIPWIAHFSDPWVDSPYYASMGEKEINRWKILEQLIIQNATKIIFTNSHALHLVMEKYPSEFRHKTSVLPHSFDINLAHYTPQHISLPPENKIQMVFTGDLYGKRSGASLFKAITELVQEKIIKNEIEVIFAGNISTSEQQLVQKFNLENIIKFKGQVSYKESLQTCATCDILLLIDAPSSQPSPFLPSKLIDYLMFFKPILGLTSEQGASADLLRDLGAFIVPPDNISAIKKSLVHILEQKKSGQLLISKDFEKVTAQYRADNVANLMENILLDATGNTPNAQDNFPISPIYNTSPKSSYSNKNMKSIIPLVCTIHKKDLINTGNELICIQGCHHEIIHSIPRFVQLRNYSASFGLQWNTFRITQLDSSTGLSISKDRLTRISGGNLNVFKDKKVLEAGCGAGRFTEILLGAGAHVFAADISTAVEANYQNCSSHSDYFICQADITNLPVLPEQFDIVICIGVIQHTPNPENTIKALCQHVKPGGILMIDHYTYGYPVTPIRRWIRAYLLNKTEEFSMKFVKKLVDILWPVHKFLYQVKNQALFKYIYPQFLYWSPVVDYHQSYNQLGDQLLYEWGLLDTHDTLTDQYKHLRSADEIKTTLKSAGMCNIEAVYAGNGVEVRAWKPEK